MIRVSAVAGVLVLASARVGRVRRQPAEGAPDDEGGAADRR